MAPATTGIAGNREEPGLAKSADAIGRVGVTAAAIVDMAGCVRLGLGSWTRSGGVLPHPTSLPSLNPNYEHGVA